MLIAASVLIVLWDIGQTVQGGPRGGVTLGIHSEIDRPILGFSVNGVTGANAFANGGDSVTCCGDTSEDTAEAIWTLNTTRTQYNAGMRLEKRNKTLPSPKGEWGENYLRVHFMSDDKVLPGWSKDSFSPYEDLHNGGDKIHVRQDAKDKLYGMGKMN